eukprot:CFRG6817T1
MDVTVNVGVPDTWPRASREASDWARNLRKANAYFEKEVRRTTTTISHLQEVRDLALTDCQVSSKTVDDRMYKKFGGLTKAQPRGLCFVTLAGMTTVDVNVNGDNVADSENNPGVAMDVVENDDQKNAKKDTTTNLVNTLRSASDKAMCAELVHVLRGLQKFGDDTDIPRYFSKDCQAKATHLVFMEKANGENAKISAMIVDGILVWLVASKNVTLAATDANFVADIEHEIYSKPRFTYTLKIAKQWYSQLQLLSVDQKNSLVHYLCTHMATIVGEVFLSDSQHIVDMSYMDRNEAEGSTVQRLQFYAIVDVRPESEGLLSGCSPTEGLEMLSAWGLSVVPHVSECAVSDQAAVQKANDDARNRQNSEGAVVYGVKEGTTVFIYKYKNTWYVYWRSVRELMRAKAPLARLRKRLTTEMYIPHPNCDAFVDEASRFYAYCRYRVEVEKSVTYDSVFSFWYDIMSSFKGSSVEYINTALAWFESEIPCSANMHLQIAMMGVPGMGKSTQARALSTLLGLPWINQDELGGKPWAYHKALSDTTTNKITSGVIADKCHHTTQVRTKMREALGTIMSLVYLVFTHPDDADGTDITNTLSVAKSRIEDREFGHRSLFDGPNARQALFRFQSDWTPLSQSEINQATAVISVNTMLCPLDMCKYILTELARVNLLSRDMPNDDEIDSALAQAKDFEIRLNRDNIQHTTTLSWSLPLSKVSQDNIRAVAWPSLLNGSCAQTHRSLSAAHAYNFTIQAAFHATLLYIPKDMNSALKQKDDLFLTKMNSTVVLKSSRIAYTSKAAALVLDTDSVPEWLSSCAEPPLHVTIAVGCNPESGYKYPPIEARKMLVLAENAQNDNTVVQSSSLTEDVNYVTLPMPIELEGTIVRTVKLAGRDNGKGIKRGSPNARDDRINMGKTKATRK